MSKNRRRNINMKIKTHIQKMILVVLMLFGIFSLTKTVSAANWMGYQDLSPYQQVDTEFRAVWVATVYNLDIPRQIGKTESAIDAWKEGYLKILDTAQAHHLNTIIFQIRPCNDAFYPSKYNPWSAYMCEYGEDPGWDPLQWMIEVTHARGMQYHAWMNPYRASVTSTFDYVQQSGTSRQVQDYDDAALQQSKENYFSGLKSSGENGTYGLIDNPVFATGKTLQHNVVLGTEKKYVLNPASNETIEHLENTIREVVENYDIDGIHFDDYFYPYAAGYASNGTNAQFKGKSFSTEPIIDYADYQKYQSSGGTLSIYDWRRENINQLIQTLSELIRELNATKTTPCAFGVSPAARWAPSPEACPTAPERAAEGGMSGSCYNYYSYSDLYADTKKWVDEEWLDYILPQAYTEMTSSYQEIVSWWSSAMKGSSVKLYIGTPLYQLDEWGDTLEINYQIRYNQSEKKRVDGYSLYDYTSMTKGKGKVGISNVVKFLWKTNALTPLYANYTYQHEVSGLAEVEQLEKISESEYQIKFKEVSDAKAYGLYAFDSQEDITNSENYTADHLIQLNLSHHPSFQLTRYNAQKTYVIATISEDNTIYPGKAIDFSTAHVNAAPTIAFVGELPEYVFVGESVTVQFELNDIDNDLMTYSVYRVVDGKESLIQTAQARNEVIEVIWKSYYVETLGISFKIVVTDGRNEVSVSSPSLDVIETCRVHQWKEATCHTAATCLICGTVEGEPLGHAYKDADCTHPKTCTRCNETVGEALGHIYKEADCTHAKTCTRCNETVGEALGHTYKEADCTHAKTCTRCNETEGNPLGHTWKEATKKEPKTCTVCGTTVGEPKKGCKKASAMTLIASILALTTTMMIFRKKK